MEDRSSPGAAAVAIHREISQKLHELIAALPPEAAALIRATYFEGLTLQEAGTKLGVSKSWASRLHAKALERLALLVAIGGDNGVKLSAVSSQPLAVTVSGQIHEEHLGQRPDAGVLPEASGEVKSESAGNTIWTARQLVR